MPNVETLIKPLPVMEAFYTLQGEGYYSGSAAWFIRLAGCDVGCVWCDVKESWNEDAHPMLEVAKLSQEAASYNPEIVIITGGEPLMHQLDALTASLKEKGISTHLETSGAYPLSGSWDWICLSPKKFKAPLPSFYPVAQELKVIVYNRSDFKWAEEHAASVNSDCKLFLQPEWSKRHEMMPLIVDYVKKNPKWRISLQTHKYLGIP